MLVASYSTFSLLVTDILRLTFSKVMQSPSFSPEFCKEWVDFVEKHLMQGSDDKELAMVIHKLAVSLAQQKVVPALTLLSLFPHLCYASVRIFFSTTLTVFQDIQPNFVFLVDREMPHNQPRCGYRCWYFSLLRNLILLMRYGKLTRF